MYLLNGFNLNRLTNNNFDTQYDMYDLNNVSTYHYFCYTQNACRYIYVQPTQREWGSYWKLAEEYYSIKDADKGIWQISIFSTGPSTILKFRLTQ